MSLTTFLFFICRGDHAKALDILRKDLRFCAPFSEDIFKEMMLLLTLDDFRFSHNVFDPCNNFFWA